MFRYDDRSMTLEERWRSARFHDMVKLWNLSDEDASKMQELQEQIKDIDHWKNDPYEVIRYYTECKGHVPNVEKMFRHMVWWRMVHDIDSISNDTVVPIQCLITSPLGSWKALIKLEIPSIWIEWEQRTRGVF